MKTSSESVSEAPLGAGQPNPGDWIGKKYRLKELRGAGGMGTVWVAHNAVLDIDVALKLMRFEQFRADPKRIFRRLLQEARAAARLEHPAIVRVFDFGLTDAGSPYIVMELLHGESLAELMAREPAMEATRAVQLLLPIADALATAHGRGIIHRDIKPENLFLARDEYGRLQPKIVDFGVARFLEGGRTMTRSGALMGTPDYMAPEQARGADDIDTRVDIWALCVVLYELVAGFRPFGDQDANYLAVLRAIVQDPPNPRLRSMIDPGLWLVLERGLRKQPHERWDTMRVLGEALALWLYERGVREDILGASIKANWLQSGLGGVKIETASMSPPAGAHPEFRIAESGSLPVLGQATSASIGPASLPPRSSRSATGHLSLPSPKSQSGAPGRGFSIGNAIEEVLLLPELDKHVRPDAAESAPLESVDVEFSSDETEVLSAPNSRLGVSSSPLVEQTRELRRLVLASIGVTALLAMAVVLLLWDQRRGAAVTQVAIPVAQPSVLANRAPTKQPPRTRTPEPSSSPPRASAAAEAADASPPPRVPRPPVQQPRRALPRRGSRAAPGLARRRRPNMSWGSSSFFSVILAGFFAAAGFSQPARAEQQRDAPAESEDDARARARSLALEGIELLEQERWQQAHERLSEAYELFQAPTVAVLDARALEKLGQQVAALERYREAAELAVDRDSPKPFRRAVKEARRAHARLSPLVPTLRIDPRHTVASDQVTLNGELVPRAEWQTARRVDPGTYTLVLRGQDAGKTEEKVTLEPGASVTVVLVRAPAHPAPPAPAPPPAAAERSRALAYTALGIGALGITGGAVAGAVMLDAKSDLDAQCNRTCPPDSRDTLGRFRTARAISIGAYSAGAVGLGIGLWMLFDSSEPVNQRVVGSLTWSSRGPGLEVGGAF